MGSYIFGSNHDLLEAYSEADTSKDVVKVQNEFLESKE